MSNAAPAHEEYYEETDDDDVEVEYVEEIEYVDDTDEEGSYIVEEYVDEDEEVEPEEEAHDDEGQGQPPVEISYDKNYQPHNSNHEMSQGSLLMQREDDNEPEQQEEEEPVELIEESAPKEESESKLEAAAVPEETAIEAVAPELDEELPMTEVGDIQLTTADDNEQVQKEAPAAEEPSKLEEGVSAPTAAVTEAPSTPNGPRSLFQRRKSFGSSVKSIGSQKSNATSTSAVSKSTGTSSPAAKPRPGLLRSGSSKSIRSIGKGIKNVFRRKSGKGNTKEDPNGKEDESERAVVADNEPVLDEPVEAVEPDEVTRAPEPEVVEAPIEPVKEAMAPVSLPSEEIPAASMSSRASAKSYQAPASPEPIKKANAAAIVSSPVAVSSPTHSVVRIKRDSAPVSPSRSNRPAVTTTETTTTTTTTTSTTSVTTKRVDASGAEAITTTTTSTTTSSDATGKGANDEVQYSYSKDGKTYFTDKLEKQDKLSWKKPEWTSNSPLRKTNKGVVLKEKGTLEKPIVVPVDKSVEKETGIGWSKPSWTKERVLKSTEKGSALKSGAEIARPITVHTNQV